MRVLAVDTATFMGTVAVVENGRLLGETSASVRAAHGETLLPHVERTLAMAGVSLAEVDLLVAGLGPGSFTGVRIGVATLKGFALATGAPIVGIGSLQVLAAGMWAPFALRAPIVDAYKGEVYVGLYEVLEGASVRERLPPRNLVPQEAASYLASGLDGARVVCAGDGLGRYPELLDASPLAGWALRAPACSDAPRAAVLAQLGVQAFQQRGPDDLARLEPMYVRSSDAKLPGSRPGVP